MSEKEVPTFGFGSWMNETENEAEDVLDEFDDDEEFESEISREELIRRMAKELEEREDFLSLEEATALGGLFGAAYEESEQPELGDDMEDEFDDLDYELKNDKSWRPLYYEDPEFARFVHKSIREAEEQAEKDLRTKLRKRKI